MKKLFSIAAGLFAAVAMNAQVSTSLLMEEDFEYEAPRALISDPIAGSDNLDAVTGWSTAANDAAAVGVFDVVSGNLSYPGYLGGQYGNSMHYSGEAGQGVFKIWDEGICKGKNIYVSFLLKIDPVTVSVTGGDYLFSFKMEPAANSWNWCGRLYAKVDPEYAGEEVSFGIQKLTDCPIKWVDGKTGPFFPVNQTLLVVIKYYVGDLNGDNAEQEAGHYDDEMYLYVNPPLAEEPTQADLTLIDPNAKDMYRWGTTKVFGSARGFYLRSADKGNIPPYTIDGIRVGHSWEEIIPNDPQGIDNTKGENVNIQKTISNGQIVINKNGVRYNVLGAEL